MSLLSLSLRSALRRLKTRPLRSLLTLLQVLLGALAMTLALSASLGSQGAGRGDPERFNLVAGSRSPDGSSSAYSLFTREGLAELLALAPDIEALALFSGAAPPQVELDGRVFQFRNAAVVSPEHFELEGLTPARGAFFGAGDAETEEAVMVISEASARVLFGDADPVGQELLLRPRFGPPGEEAQPPLPFRVVGTFVDPEGDDFQAFTQPPVYLPIWNPGIGGGMGGDMGGGMGAAASTLNVRARPGRGEAAREQLVTAARQVYADELQNLELEPGSDFYIEEPGERFGLPANFVNPVVIIFGLIGIVALIAGAIGIFSVTVVDIVERTREIGLRRALGASGGRITVEFMVEAAVLAALGGLIGVALAAFLIPLLAAQVGTALFFGVSLKWQPLAALGVVGFVVFVGAFLGLFPALRAGRMRPIEALRDL